MKKLSFIALLLFVGFYAIAQSTTLTIYSTGAAGSFTTGFANDVGGRTDNTIRTTNSPNIPRGYAVFSLASVPAGITVNSCSIGYNVAAFTPAVASTCNTYGYAGSLKTVTVAATLYADMVAGTLISTTDYGSSLGNQSIPTNAAGNAFITANLGGTISVCWTGGGSNVYTTITGETGTATTTGAHAPYLQISYCTGVSNVTATASPNPGCPGAPVTLTAGGTGTTTYSWAGPGGFTSTQMNPTFTATTTSVGVYTLTAYNAGGCATTVTSAPLTLSSLPAAISGASSVCFPGTTTLTDVAGAGTWASSTTSVANIGAATGLITAASQGTTTITYTATSTGCKITRVETVNASPVAISGNVPVCPGNTNTLTDASTGGTWSSSVPTIGTIGSVTGIVGGVLTGTTVVTYNNGCGAPATAIVTVNPLPAAITGPGTVCPGGGTITLNDVTSGGTWSSSSTVNATAANAGPNTGVVTGLITGTTTITYTSLLNCIATTVITVDPLPAPINGVLSECAGTASTLTDAISGGTWSSSTIPVATIDSNTGLLIGISSGTTVITYKTGCGYITAIDTAIPAPTAIIGTDSLCVGGFTTYASMPLGGTWTSSTPAIATVLSGSGLINGLSAGKSAITYTIPPGCFVVDSVNVLPLPPVISGTRHLCPGTTTTLTDGFAGGIWSSEQNYIATVNGTTGVVTGVMADTTIIVYTDRSGCQTSATITVNPLPASIIGGITTCATLTDTLYDATAGGVWSSGAPGIASISSTGVVTTISGGTAIITYKIPATGCLVSKTFVVNPLPAALVTYNGVTNTFYTDNFYATYQWYNTVQSLIPGATTYSTAALYYGNYWVTVTDTNGCTATSVPYAYTIGMGVPTHTGTLLRIYPNPANDVVYIESGIRVRAVISDIDGKIAQEQADAKQLDISKLANGIYFISLYADNGERLIVQKLIKQ